MAQILLVEPDRLLAGTYRQALESVGHQVVMCASAQSAIFAADETKPDVVILELQLIGHSGIEFLYEFHSYPDWQNIPVLIQSHVPAGEFAGCWDMLQTELGVRAYFYKPLTTIRALLASVAEFAPVAA